ncbi:hypothetical protein EV121DRAFT_284016 [Schizophyllum commune]
MEELRVDGEPHPPLQFLYSNRLWRQDTKRLAVLYIPVFECHDGCRCGPSCPNRVVQEGRQAAIAIKKTVHKAWGVFNGPTILQRGQYIGTFTGELLTPEEAAARDGQLRTPGAPMVIDASRAGNFTRFLNHSCDANLSSIGVFSNEPNNGTPKLAFFANRDIAPGEELCIRYMSIPDQDGAGDAAETGQDGAGDAAETGEDAARCLCGSRNCRGAYSIFICFAQFSVLFLASCGRLGFKPSQGIHSQVDGDGGGGRGGAPQPAVGQKPCCQPPRTISRICSGAFLTSAPEWYRSR